jgi:hypothetical protein
MEEIDPNARTEFRGAPRVYDQEAIEILKEDALRVVDAVPIPSPPEGPSGRKLHQSMRICRGFRRSWDAVGGFEELSQFRMGDESPINTRVSRVGFR